MTSIASVSLSELKGRRISLRRQRRRQVLHAVWRTLASSGLAGGLVWAATQPDWVIRKPTQIAVEGNQYISDQSVRSLLSLTYPQPLLRIQPQEVAQKLTSPQSPIAKATVTRQLFPPSLMVRIEERQPVAIAIRANTVVPQYPTAASKDRVSKRSPVSLLDANGALVPLERYTALKASVPLPKLRIIGMRDQYLPNWPQLYVAVRNSPVKISELDWRNPENIILKTELGIVHLGPYNAQIPDQLNILARMRSLPAKLNANQIAYIDLKDPESPAIQMVQSTPTATPKLPHKTPNVRPKQKT
jgi:cell division protein FtsQ